jgi:hypothetical protein
MGEVKNLVVGMHALRTFKIHHAQMHSLSAPNGLWRNGVCEAECIERLRGWSNDGHPDLPAPQLDCSCGIYGTFSLDALVVAYRAQSQDVLTVIAVEGRTIIGTRGVRTERARVVAWWTPKLWATAICTAQFIDAKRYGTMHQMLDDYKIPIEEATAPSDAIPDGSWWTS